MGSNAPAGVRERADRAVQEHLVRLFPAALDVAVVGAQLDEPAAKPRPMEDLFGPEGTDEADVIDFGRALFHQLTGKGPADAGDDLARRHRQDQPEPTGERPGLQLVASEPDTGPVMDTGVELSENLRRRLEELQVKGASRSYDEERKTGQLLDLADPMRLQVRRANTSNGRR
jgi:hypothetical protein